MLDHQVVGIFIHIFVGLAGRSRLGEKTIALYLFHVLSDPSGEQRITAERTPFHPQSEGAVLTRTINPTGTSSFEQFPGDRYSNLRKLSEGLRRLRGEWERYRRGECEVVGIGGEPLPSSLGKGLAPPLKTGPLV